MARPSSRLSGADRERYGRQLSLPGWGEPAQRRLRSATVFVAGAGGLGSPVSIYLAAAGVGTLRLCDEGVVEQSNLNRQVLYGEADVGRAKVEAAREALGRLNPAVQVVGLRERIGSGNVAALAAGAALLIDCLDNFQTRHVLNAYAVQARRPLLHAGVSGLCGQITLLHPPHTACLACLVPAAPPAESPPILGATAGLLGCLQAMEALKFLTGTGSSLLGRLLFCDGEAMRFEEVRLERDPDCPVCGGPGRRRRGP